MAIRKCSQGVRFCLWGARRGYVQIGSAEDCLVQAERVVLRNVSQQMAKLGRALGVPLAKAAEQMSEAIAVLTRPPR